MARLSLILGILTAVVGLLGGFKLILNEWRLWKPRGRWIGKWFVFLVVYMLGAFGMLSGLAQATIINAADCTVSAVTTAIGTAVNGDTVVLPSCSVSWASAVSVGKSITVQGQGIGNTTLTASGSNQLFAITSLSSPSTLLRFTGMSLTVTTGSAISMNSSLTVLALRIDHNAFVLGFKTIQTFGYVNGVIDHNTFLNANNAIRIVGDDNTSWSRPIAMGTSDALFIEDNTFTQTNAAPSDLNEIHYCERGGRTVLRHNFINAGGYTIFSLTPYDVHPNFGGSVLPQPNNGYNPPGVRACVTHEVYENIFEGNTGYRLLYIRGGSSIVYNNTLTLNSGSLNFIELIDEEATNNGLFDPLRTAWPAQDQINNSFYWNNTIGGTPITDAAVGASSQPFIQKDRDYFMHAPESTGGKECWVDPAFAGSTTASDCVNHPGRAGGSTTAPTNGSTSTLDTGHMIKVSDGPNAYYPYTPYTYPHPLQGVADTTPPAAPMNLRVIEILLPIIGLGWHFRKAILAGSLFVITGLSTVTTALPLLTAKSYHTLRCTTAKAIQACLPEKK